MTEQDMTLEVLNAALKMTGDIVAVEIGTPQRVGSYARPSWEVPYKAAKPTFEDRPWNVHFVVPGEGAFVGHYDIKDRKTADDLALKRAW